MTAIRLLPPWAEELSLMKQAVLIMAIRGPDGFPKQHGCKPILWYYRGCLLAAAHKGRHLRDDEHVPSLMTLRGFSGAGWLDALKQFSAVVDELPLHYFTHLMHGVQVMSHHHPDPKVRMRWYEFYSYCCNYLHVPRESREVMDMRLNDFDRSLDEVIE